MLNADVIETCFTTCGSTWTALKQHYSPRHTDHEPDAAAYGGVVALHPTSGYHNGCEWVGCDSIKVTTKKRMVHLAGADVRLVAKVPRRRVMIEEAEKSPSRQTFVKRVVSRRPNTYWTADISYDINAFGIIGHRRTNLHQRAPSVGYSQGLSGRFRDRMARERES